MEDVNIKSKINYGTNTSLFVLIRLNNEYYLSYIGELNNIPNYKLELNENNLYYIKKSTENDKIICVNFFDYKSNLNPDTLKYILENLNKYLKINFNSNNALNKTENNSYITKLEPNNEYTIYNYNMTKINNIVIDELNDDYIITEISFNPLELIDINEYLELSKKS